LKLNATIVKTYSNYKQLTSANKKPAIISNLLQTLLSDMTSLSQSASLQLTTLRTRHCYQN